MATINFDEKEKQGSWTWHYGNVEQEGKDYPFSLLEMYDGNSDTSSLDLTWCDDIPQNSEDLEKQILDEFSNI